MTSYDDMENTFRCHIYVLEIAKKENNGSEFTIAKEDLDVFGRRLSNLVNMPTDLEWLTL